MAIATNQLETRHKILFFVLALVAATLLFFLMYVQPQRNRRMALEAELTVQQHNVEQMQEFLKENPVPEKYQKFIDQKLTTVNQLLPNTSDISAFLAIIEHYARKSGVQVSIVSPGMPKVQQGYTEVPVEITVKGKNEQVQLFIRQLEGGQRLAAVSKASIKSIAPDVHARLTVIVYSFNNISDKQAVSPGPS